MLLYKDRIRVEEQRAHCRSQLVMFGKQVQAYNEIMVAVLLTKHNDEVKVDGDAKAKVIFNNELTEKIESFRAALNLWKKNDLKLNYLLFATIKGWEVYMDLENNPRQVSEFFRFGEMGRIVLIAKNITKFFPVIINSPVTENGGTLASANLELMYYLHITQLFFILMLKLWDLKTDEGIQYKFLYKQMNGVKVYNTDKLTFMNCFEETWGQVNLSKLDRAFFAMQEYKVGAFAVLDLNDN